LIRAVGGSGVNQIVSYLRPAVRVTVLDVPNKEFDMLSDDDISH
jgi:hypothetical protein